MSIAKGRLIRLILTVDHMGFKGDQESYLYIPSLLLVYEKQSTSSTLTQMERKAPQQNMQTRAANMKVGLGNVTSNSI